MNRKTTIDSRISGGFDAVKFTKNQWNELEEIIKVTFDDKIRKDISEVIFNYHEETLLQENGKKRAKLLGRKSGGNYKESTSLTKLINKAERHGENSAKYQEELKNIFEKKKALIRFVYNLKEINKRLPEYVKDKEVISRFTEDSERINKIFSKKVEEKENTISLTNDLKMINKSLLEYVKEKEEKGIPHVSGISSENHTKALKNPYVVFVLSIKEILHSLSLKISKTTTNRYGYEKPFILFMKKLNEELPKEIQQHYQSYKAFEKNIVNALSSKSSK